MNQESMTALLELESSLMRKIEEIQKDDRQNRAPANVMINAPLALVQVGMSSRLQAYQVVLAEIRELLERENNA